MLAPFVLRLKELLQTHEDLVVSAVTLDADHVLQFAQLSEHLLQAVVSRHTQPDATLHTSPNGHAEDALDIESPTGEQATDV
jgi:hypothetical protein